MMNKKGQVLVVFVLILPLILTFIGLIIDVGNSLVLRRKNENILKDAISYAFKDYELEDLNEKIELVEKNIKQNIQDYESLKIDTKDDILEVNLKINYKSIFSSIFDIGLNKINLKVKYDIVNKKIVREW